MIRSGAISKREYEESQLNDLKWLGMDYDEGPEKPGEPDVFTLSAAAVTICLGAI